MGVSLRASLSDHPCVWGNYSVLQSCQRPPEPSISQHVLSTSGVQNTRGEQWYKMQIPRP